LTSSRGALVGIGAGAVVLVAGLVLTVVLLARGGDGETGGEGGQAAPPSADSTDEPSESPSDAPSKAPVGDPPGPNWYHSPELGVGFNLPDGWQAQVDGDLIRLADPTGAEVGTLKHDPNQRVADVQADPAPYIEAIAQDKGLTSFGPSEAAPVDFIETPLAWHEQPFFLDGDLGPAMWIWYLADDPAGGDWQLLMGEGPGVELDVVFSGRFTILKSLTPDGL
jgi:hypothetical protein